MTYSRYFDATNSVLANAGQAQIATTTIFDSGPLEKAQFQAKLYVDKANRRLIRRNRARFIERQYTLTTSSSSNAYLLNAGPSSQPNVFFENIKEDSMFLTSTGQGFGPIHNLPYDKWKALFPEGETTKGYPIRWIALPPTEYQVADTIAFSPPPNGTYSIVFNYFEDAKILVNSTDIIQWPQLWEDVLWDYGRLYLEIALSEGKAGDIKAVMEGLDQELRQLTMGPSEYPGAVDIGLSLDGTIPWRRRRRSARSYP